MTHRLALLLALLLAPPAAARDLEPTDFRPERPGATIRLVLTGDHLRSVGATARVTGGGVALVYHVLTDADGERWVYSLLTPQGLVPLFRDERGGLFSVLGQSGSTLLIMAGGSVDSSGRVGPITWGDVYAIDGVPRPASAGDLSPGARDEEGVYRPAGDGVVDIFDVVVLLRVAVGIEELGE